VPRRFSTRSRSRRGFPRPSLSSLRRSPHSREIASRSWSRVNTLKIVGTKNPGRSTTGLPALQGGRGAVATLLRRAGCCGGGPWRCSGRGSPPAGASPGCSTPWITPDRPGASRGDAAQAARDPLRVPLLGPRRDRLADLPAGLVAVNGHARRARVSTPSCQPVIRAGFRSMRPSRVACSMTRTSTRDCSSLWSARTRRRSTR
jgi:hypothetical protein